MTWKKELMDPESEKERAGKPYRVVAVAYVDVVFPNPDFCIHDSVSLTVC